MIVHPRKFSPNFSRQLAAFMVAVCTAALAGPPALEISATMSVHERVYELHEGVVRCAKTNSYSFPLRCIISKTRWFMESRYFGNSVHWYYFDGTNNYDTFEHKRGRAQASSTATGEPTKTSTSPRYITVIPGAHPLNHLGINVPWMAFCSSVYLDQPDRIIPLPGPQRVRQSPYAFGFTDKTERFDDDLGLPRSMELWPSSSLMRKSPHRAQLIRNEQMNPIRVAFFTPVPALEDRAHCNYSVDSWTNVGGWHIPVEFRMAVPPDVKLERFVSFEAHGKSDWIATASGVPEFRIQQGTNVVTDLRVRDPARFVDAVTYTLNGGATLPTVSDECVVAALREASSAAPADPAAGMRHRMSIFYVLLGGLVFMPAIIFLRSLRLRSKSVTTKLKQCTKIHVR